MPSASSRPTSLLFEMPDGKLDAVPNAIPPASFVKLGALEVQHIERWVAASPEVLGEQLLVITTQFAGFDKSKDRSDVLALDEAGKLVVIELKREADSRQDLQALRYAAYSATLRLDDLVELYVAHRATRGEELSEDEARDALTDHVVDGDIEAIDDDERPRIILVAADFQVGVTATSLWLRENYDVDISCVQLVPYQLDGKLLLSSSVLIPLPEASAYTVQRDRKRQRAKGARIDWSRVKEVVASIPVGHWASYQDVAVAAGGSPGAARALGQGLMRRGDILEGVHRVLDRHGRINDKWAGKHPSLPANAVEVRELLEEEGLHFDGDRADKNRRCTVSDLV